MLSPLTGSLSPLGVGKARGSAWYNYLVALSPLLWFRMNDASGSLINSGSAASSDAAFSGTTPPTYGVTGQLGTNEAITYPLDCMFTIPRQAAWAGDYSFEWVLLLKLTNPPPSGNTRLLGVGGGGTGFQVVRRTADGFIAITMRNTLNATFDTQNNNRATVLNQYHMLSFWYDDSGDRKARIAIDGVETTYSVQVALTGTYQEPWVNGLTVGNVAGLTADFRGDWDELALLPNILTTQQRLDLFATTGL